MATIKFDILAKPVVPAKKQHVFSDVHLDIVEDAQNIGSYNRKNNLSDIKLDYDLDAIKSSLINLFNTVPGQNLMVPEYGLNLNQFLFRPVSESEAGIIGNTILNGINTYEPRATVENIKITPQQDNNQYIIDLTISLPNIGIQFTSFKGFLTQNGFNF